MKLSAAGRGLSVKNTLKRYFQLDIEISYDYMNILAYDKLS